MRIAARLALPAGALLLLGCGADDGPAPSPPPEPVVPRPASAPPRPAEPARDEAELLRLEQLYAQALIRKDRAFLMRFYAPDWRGGNWMGFWSKSDMLKSVLSDRYVVRSMALRDVKVRLMGDIAIVQGVDEEVTSMGGRDTSGKWTFTDIFARRNGQWVAIASHTSEVKPAGE